MKIFARFRNWYRNWRHPLRLTPAEAQDVLNKAYRKMVDNVSGLPPVMHGEVGFVPVSSYDDKTPCTETEIGNVVYHGSRQLKFPAGTVIVCPRCEFGVATANRAIYRDDLIDSSAWDWTRHCTGDFHCPECGALYADGHGRIELHTKDGWIG